MSLSELFIRKPIATALVIVILSVFGVICYFKLPVSSLPNVDSPVITVNVSYPGASPETMASTCATPLENQFMSINGLEKIISNNTDGQTTITLTFELDKNIDLMAPDVQAAINRATEYLPTDLPAPPNYDKTNPSDKPIMYIMVTSDTLTAGEIYDYAYRMIGKRISMIEGISKVDTYGSKFAVRVRVFPEKLAAYDLSLAAISAALDAGTVALPGGSLDSDVLSISIQPQGQLRKAKDYDKLIVAYRNGAPVYLSDVASCIDSVENTDVEVRFGFPSTGECTSGGTCLPVSKAAGANTVAVARNIRTLLKELQTQLPASITVQIMYDNSIPIIQSINDVQTTIIVAIVLVVLIIFLFLGRLRETIIPSLVIPVALLGTFIVMDVVNFSLDNLSLMAMVLCVGFLVDDAIVVLENTVRHVEEGIKPVPAAIKSMKELTFTVISTSVALAIVFLPLAFMPGVVGRNFSEFAMTVVIAIICSTILAIIFTPVLCSRWLKPTGGKETLVQKTINKFISAMVKHYGVMLKWVLHRKWLTVIVWFLCIIGTIWTFFVLPKDFIPPGDSGAIQGVMILPMGTSADQCHDMQDQVTKILMGNKYVANQLTVTCPSRGADKSTAYVVVILVDIKDRPPIDKVMSELQSEMMNLTGGIVFLSAIPLLELSTGGESTATGSKYSYLMRGQNSDELYDVADKLQTAMGSIKGVYGIQTSVKLNMPQLDVDILRDRASTFGISATDIESALLVAYAQGKSTTFYTDSDTYDVIALVDQSDACTPSDLSKIYIKSPITGENVPMSALAQWHDTIGPQNIPHSQQLNSATLSFSLDPSVPLSAATKAIEDAAQKIMPPSVSGQLQGEAAEFQESIKALGILLFVAVFLMYAILGMLYESYIHPLTVLSTLPVAAFGGLVTVLLFGRSLNIYAYIGLFALLGIIAKNGIMMVDFAKQYLDENKDATGFDAIYHSCTIRFRPILMTGMSTIMGTMPIALGMGSDGSSRVPMGLIIVGGMLFAQVITLFVTPGIYLYMQWIQEHWLEKNKAKRDKELGIDQLT